MSPLEQFVLTLCIQVIAVTSLASLVLKCGWFRPTTKHAIGVSAVCLTLLSPLLVLGMPKFGADVLQNALTGIRDNEGTFSGAADARFSNLTTQSDAIVTVEKETTVSLPTSPNRSFDSTYLDSENGRVLAAIIALVWFAGSFFQLHRMLGGLHRLRNELIDAKYTPAPPAVLHLLKGVFRAEPKLRLLISERIKAPVVIGWLSPSIVLPQSVWVSPKKRDNVLIHEFAHIFRRDHLILLVQQLASVIYWWNPFVKHLNREIGVAREEVCDNYVLSHTDPITYSETLLAIAELCCKESHSPEFLCFFSQSPKLESRIAGLLSATRSLKVRANAYTRATIIIALSLVTGFTGGVNEFSRVAQAQDNVQLEDSRTTSGEPSFNAGARTQPAEAAASKLEDQAYRVASGRVLDSTGQSVSGCLIVSEVVTVDHERHSIVAHSGQDGFYEIQLPTNGDFFPSYYAWAYKDGYGVRPLNFSNQFRSSNQAEELDIVLSESNSIEIEVLSEDGSPIAGAIIEPSFYNLPNGPFIADVPQGLAGSPPTQILEATRVKTDEQGLAILSGYFKSLLGAIVVRSEKHGEQSFWCNGEDKMSVNFGPTAPLRIKLVTPTPRLYAGCHVRINSNGGYLDPLTKKRHLNRFAEFDVAFDEEGKIEIPAVLVGGISIVFQDWINDAEFLPIVDKVYYDAIPNQLLDIKLELARSVEITGVVMTLDTMKPAEGVRVVAWNPSSPVHGTSVLTDEEGRFRVLAAAGKVDLRLIHLGKFMSDYDRPKQLEKLDVTSGGRPIQIAPILLPRR